MIPINQTITNLFNTIKQLRGKNGCPWDKKQTPLSLCRYLREEVAELVEAIENTDTQNTCEELGDVIYILIMISEMHSERKIFSFEDVIEGINKKLIRRHPHVFDNPEIKSEEELRIQWEKIKKAEKKRNN